MRWRRVPLWVVGLVSWPLVAAATAAALPEEPGPWSERPGAWGLVAGGCVALPLLVAAFVRKRRLWLAALTVWGALFCIGVLDGIRSGDSDLDQGIGWAFFVPGLVLFPLFVIFLVAETWARRPRRWRVEYEGSKVVFVRRR